LEEALDVLIEAIEVALSMAHRKFDLLDASCKNAWGIRIDLQPHPSIDEITGRVRNQGDPAFTVIAVEAGKQPQIDDGLEPVAYPDDKLAGPDELVQLVSKVETYFGCEKNPGAMIVRPAEASTENQDVVIFKLDFGTPSIPVNDLVDVDTVRIGSGQFQGVIRLIVAVQPKPGEHQCFHRGHIKPPGIMGHQ
jgi:hypothetical protein